MNQATFPRGPARADNGSLRGGLPLRLLTIVFLLLLVAVFGLRGVFSSLESDLRAQGDNERARLFVGEEIVLGIQGMERSLYLMAATQNSAGLQRIYKLLDSQIDKLMHDLNVLQFGGTVSRRMLVNVGEQDEAVRTMTYQPDAQRGPIMELIEIGPHLGQVRDRADELERLLNRRWEAIEKGDKAAFFDIEDEIAVLLKRLPPHFERLNENANRLFLEGDAHLRELDARLQERRTRLQQIETLLIALILISGALAGMLYLRRLAAALDAVRDARDEIERQRQQVATMLDTLSDGVYATDLDGRITFMNAMAERLLGWQANDLLGRDNHQAIHHSRPDGTPFPKETCPLLRVLREGVSLVGEEHFIRRGGEHFPVSFRSNPLIRNGVVAGALVSFQDITRQQASQARIRLQQAALDAAANMIVIADRDGIIEYVNPAFTACTGYDPREVIGRKTSVLRSGVHAPEFYRSLWDTVLRGKVWEGELTNRRKDGALYQEQMTVTPIIENGQVAHFVAIKRDVTEEVRTRTRLVLVEAAILEADQGILITDADADEQGPRIEYVNPAFTRITGYPASDVVGKRTGLLRGPETDPARAARLRQAIAAGESLILEMDYCRKDGVPYVAELHYSPVRDDRGRVTHYIALLSDISQRKAVEKALHDAHDQALENARIKSEFLSNMSHEIRTPMNGIIGMTDLLLDTPLSAEQREFASLVRDSAQSLLTIINDILDFSKIESGKLEIETIDFSPLRVVEGVVELLVLKAREKGLAMVVRGDPELPKAVRGDPTRLRQVLLNLVGNAVKFTSQGEIQVRATQTSRNGKPEIRFEVRDTGIGMSAAGQARLFQSFSQADSSTTRKFGGTGLGLAISKQLVELMGGEIGVDSVEGAGSTFWFTLPLVPSSASIFDDLADVPDDSDRSCPSDDMPSVPAASGVSMRSALDQQRLILLAEDNPTNQRVAQLHLAKLGYAVHIVDNGQEAVETHGTLPYAAILMDCQMPVMDGFEATATIRRNERPAGRHTPIIAMTAHAMQGDRERCLAAGMDDYISKPIDPAELGNLLGKWLGKVVENAPAGAPRASRALSIDFDRLKDLDDGQGLLAKLFEMFSTSTPQLVERLDKEIEQREANRVKAIAHELKGSCGNLGIDQLASIAASLETAAGQADWPRVESLRDEILAEFALVNQLIEEHFNPK